MMATDGPGTLTDSLLRTANEHSTLEPDNVPTLQLPVGSDVDPNASTSSAPPPPAELDCGLAAVHGDGGIATPDHRSVPSDNFRAHDTTSSKADEPNSSCDASDALWKFSSQYETSTVTNRSLTRDVKDVMAKIYTDATLSECDNEVGDKVLGQAPENVLCDAPIEQEEPKNVEEHLAAAAFSDFNSAELSVWSSDVQPDCKSDGGLPETSSTTIFDQDEPIYATLSLFQAAETNVPWLCTHSAGSRNIETVCAYFPDAVLEDTTSLCQLSPTTSCPPTEESKSPPVLKNDKQKDANIRPPQGQNLPGTASKQRCGSKSTARWRPAAEPVKKGSGRQKQTRDCSILPVGKRVLPERRQEQSVVVKKTLTMDLRFDRPTSPSSQSSPTEHTPTVPRQRQQRQSDNPQLHSEQSPLAEVVFVENPSSSSYKTIDVGTTPPNSVYSTTADESVAAANAGFHDAVESFEGPSWLPGPPELIPFFAQSDVGEDRDMLSLLSLMKIPAPHAHTIATPVEATAAAGQPAQYSKVEQPMVPSRRWPLAELQEQSCRVRPITNENRSDSEFSLPTLTFDL